MPPNMCQEVSRGLRLNKGFKEPVPPRGCGRQGHRKFQKNMESDRKASHWPCGGRCRAPQGRRPQTAKVLGDSLVFLEEKVVGLRLLSLPVRPPCKTGRRPEGYFFHSFIQPIFAESQLRARQLLQLDAAVNKNMQYQV